MYLKHLKRALALVLALMLSVPVAFAQEETEVQVVEEATAAFVEEAVEELGELSLGEFVEEELVEEVPEEIPADEPEDEEELVLDMELGSLQVLLPDDPMVANMQLNEMGSCTHYAAREKYVVFANKSGKSTIKSYEVCDEKSHWTIGDLYLYEICNYCFETSYHGLVKKNARFNYFHGFNSKGKCIDCGYRNPVKEHTEVRREYIANKDIKPINDGNAEGHLITGDLIDRTYHISSSVEEGYIPDADVIVEADVQWREPHTDIVDGVCQDCGYRTGCSHENLEVRPDYYLRSFCSDSGDEFTHNYYDGWTDRLYCVDCGSELRDEYFGDPEELYPAIRQAGKGAQQPHTYENGRCMQCGHKAAFTLSNKTLKMGIGEKYTLKYAFTNELGACGVTFSSSKSSIASVNKESGEITAKKTGTVTITAKAENGKKVTCKVTVYKKPSSIKLSASELVLGVGETAKLTYKLSSKSYTRVTWTVDPENPIVSVDAGVITALSEGVTTVTATTHNGLSKSCTVTVKTAPTDADVSIDLDKAVIGVKETTYARAALSENCAGKITYSIDEGDAATIDANTGKITGKKVGVVIVKASAYNDASAIIQLEVKPAPSKVRITNAPKKLGIGQKYQLQVKLGADGEDCEGTVTFSSSSSKIASVDKNTGLITPKKTGTVKITATSHHSKKIKHTVTIKVYKKPTKATLNKTEIFLGETETYDLGVKFPSGSYSPVVWSVDSACATVDQNGLVTGVAPGTATVTAELYNKSLTCTVNVGYAPESVDFGFDTMFLHAGQKMTFKAAPLSSKGTSYGKITYSSGDTRIATVSSSGTVTAKKAGIVTITAKAYNGPDISYELYVVPAVKSVKINIPSRIPAGSVFGYDPETEEYTDFGIYDYITVSPNSLGTSVFALTSIKSSKTSVAAVGLFEEDGMPVLIALKPGKFTLTVKTYNGKTAKKTITVY